MKVGRHKADALAEAGDAGLSLEGRIGSQQHVALSFRKRKIQTVVDGVIQPIRQLGGSRRMRP